MAARYGHLINKWTVAAVAALALMAVLLATVLPAWAQNTDPTIIRKTVYHEENKQQVDTFDATGLNVLKVFWYLEGTDAGQFKVGSRAGRSTTLEFKSPPDYEDPNDGPFDVNDDGDTEDVGEAGGSNRYRVTLRGGDGGADESKIFEVTVVVTNAKEDGKITLTPIQPQAARLMTADLSDPDKANAAGRLYTWTSDVSSSGPFTTTIQGPGSDHTYRPSNADDGRFIRVEVTYRDGATVGDELARAQATSDYMVRLQPSFNRAPTLPDQRPDTTVLTDYLTARRVVAEGLDSGTLVGPPVTAVDHDGDVLTYTLGGADATKFDIDPKTGQITTDVEFEADGATGGEPANCATPNACVVTVTATDPSGLNTVEPVVAGVTAGTLGTVVTVNIAIRPVDEPTAGVGTSTTEQEFITGDPTDSAATLTLNTLMYQDRPERVDATTGTQGTNSGDILATYTATDDDADPDVEGRMEITWYLAGPDASDFIIGADTDVDGSARDGSVGNLRFKNHPNYEKPADENEDNVYELLVVASDPQFNTSTLWVTIKVTNQEEGGEVSFNQRQPAVGVAITAELDDEDGVVGAINWQWHRVTEGDTSVSDITDTSSTAISSATSDTYTPVDTDVGTFLRAVATYEDKQESGAMRNAGDTAATIADEGFDTDNNLAATANEVLEEPADPGNRAPVIQEMTREYTVLENNTTAVIGVAVAATDFVGDTTTSSEQALVYSIEGPDAAYFKIGRSLADLGNENGQLRAKKGLDYEDKTRGGGRLPDRITYNITVKATDPFGAASAEVPVKITVTDVLENANISVKSGAEIEHIGRNVSVSFAENGTGPVADFDAADPDEDSIVWYVVPDTGARTTIDPAADGSDPNLDPSIATSTDYDLFEVNPQTGVLTFKTPPNYEDVEDGTAAGPAGGEFRDNIYQVVVRARSLDDDDPTTVADGEDVNATHLLRVKVLDLPENPVFRVSTGARARDEDYGEELAATRGPNRPIGLPVTAADPDNPRSVDPATDPATLTYTLEGSDAASFGIVPATGQLLTKDVLDYEIKNMYDVTVKASDDTEMDPAKRDDTIAIGIEVDDVVEPNPVPLTVRGLAEVSYEENGEVSVADYTAVGAYAATVTWHNPQGDDGEYFQLEGPASGSTTVMLKFRSPPDYENPRGMPMSDTNTNTYNLTVEIEHTSTGSTAILPVEVTVTNAEELGDLSGPSRVSYAENGTADLGAYTVDGRMANAATWSLSGADMARFDLDTTTGSSVMLMFAASPNYEVAMDANSDNTYMVTLEAMVSGETDMHDVTITVTDVNDPGTVTIAPDPDILQPGTELTAEVDDEDGIPTPITAQWQWSRSTTKDGIYAHISGATSMTYTPAEADHGYYLRATVVYTDHYSSNQTASATTTAMVVFNDAPMFAAETATRMVPENSPGGTNVGDPVMATDAGDTLTYALSGADAMYFDIGESTGQITVGADAMLDYEMPRGMAMSDTNTNDYMVIVTATDSQGAMDTIDVTIMVTDVDENTAPMFAAETATRMVPENSPGGTNVGDPVMATDAGDTLTYALSGADAMYFDIGESTGQITVGADAMLDYEMPRGMAMSDTNTNDYMVIVTATDSQGAMDTIDVTIMVTDVDENTAPMFAAETATRMVPENSPGGTNVGDPVMATDAGDTLTYALSGADAMYFDIGESTGQITVGADAMLDYEMPRGMAMSDTNTNDYMVIVTATDSQGAMDTIDVTIMVTDVDENTAPMFAAETATRMVPENSPGGTNVGDPVMATDAGDTLTYALSGADAMYFDIGESTGQITVGADAMLDYEMPRGMAMSDTNTNDYMVIVTATDSQGAMDTIDVTIMVTDVDEGDPLVNRYDANDNGEIEKSEVIKAINDYLFPPGGVEIITKAEVITLINLYLFGNDN